MAILRPRSFRFRRFASIFQGSDSHCNTAMDYRQKTDFRGSVKEDFEFANVEEEDRVLRNLRRSRFGEVDKLISVKSLQHGTGGRVWLLRRERDKKLIVCKAIPHIANVFTIPIEVELLQGLLPRHDRIIRLRNWFHASTATQMYFDYLDGGDLEQLSYQYYSRELHFPESFLWHIFLQLSEAVAFLQYGYDAHRQKKPSKWQKVLHRDIKPPNVFLRLPLSYPGKGLYPSAVLADFGLASLYNSDDCIYGTPEWQPPEIPKASRKADVWAVGAVVYSLMEKGFAPIARMPRTWCGSFDEWCCQPKARDTKFRNTRYTPELMNCVHGALHFDKEERWNSIELVNTILHSERRKICMKEEWRPLARWAFEGDPRMKLDSKESSTFSENPRL